uniref:Uncharacterized protein n=1 Tax=Corethron hystrix TaxID=216773 RepID=A0A7S1BH51_9STRA|mmetsp:Transcript_27770/g.63618  ORF Transcript_27770/g.63618 Transcript_27770/m.63618 type:complete len:230 (+) Transcript_27770:618-1307(+)
MFSLHLNYFFSFERTKHWTLCVFVSYGYDGVVRVVMNIIIEHNVKRCIFLDTLVIHHPDGFPRRRSVTFFRPVQVVVLYADDFGSRIFHDRKNVLISPCDWLSVQIRGTLFVVVRFRGPTVKIVTGLLGFGFDVPTAVQPHFRFVPAAAACRDVEIGVLKIRMFRMTSLRKRADGRQHLFEIRAEGAQHDFVIRVPFGEKADGFVQRRQKQIAAAVEEEPSVYVRTLRD